ncbi:MAG: bacitracin ABC transporter ATP-binding protein [Methanobacteriales archaeon HGW-Methanobacteriales-2]|nr:MAG: bacitracin ABC transporter ATP-binding protein [Methanobacteriales archaeon HGW-Methanobacteriales-2]
MKYIIETKNLTKIYGKEIGVDSINIKVKKGTIYGLLGRNGAGKTTLMCMLMNLYYPTYGEIFLFGENYQTNPQLYKRIGSIIESPGFYENLTGEENLKYFAKLRGQYNKEDLNYALNVMDLDTAKEKVFGKYSMGMKQRLSIAAAIMHKPDILILDEPVNGLDPVGINEVRKYLKRLCQEQGVTILVSSHILGEIERLVDTIGVIHEGKLIEEISMEKLQNNNDNYVEFEVSNIEKASQILKEKFSIENYIKVQNNSLRIYSNFENRGKINNEFVEEGIEVSKIVPGEYKLEDYFSRLIGDDSIA